MTCSNPVPIHPWTHSLRHVAQFCDLYLRSMAAKIQDNVKKNADALAEKFMNFEVSYLVWLFN